MNRWIIEGGDQLLGDRLMQTPALRALKLEHPDNYIHYIAGTAKKSHTLLLENPYIDDFRTVHDPDPASDEAVREEGASLVQFDCMRAFQWGVQNKKTLAEGLAHQLGVECPDLQYDYALIAHELVSAHQLYEKLSPEGKPIVLVARHSASCSSNDPNIRRANKCVANRIWVDVAKWLLKEGYVPVAVGGPGEDQDTRYMDWPGVKLYGEDIRVVGALTTIAAATLTVDTGIRHLAAAAGGSMYCVSGAIPLELIRCMPIHEDQQIFEEHVPLQFVTPVRILQGAKKVLG